MRSSPPTSRGASRRSRASSGANGAAHLLELGLEGDLAERPVVARQLDPQVGQRRLAGRVDEQRGDVVEELVADRSLDRPVAQRLAGVEDLLDPHVPGAALAQPPQVAGRVGEPVGVVDAQAVDRALARQPQREPVRLLEDVLVLLPDRGQVVDVEEAAVAAGLLVDVEEARAQRRIGPVAVAVVGRHVVRARRRGSARARRARAAAASASNSRSPPSSSENRVGSITS